MYGHGLNYGDLSGQVVGHGGISWVASLLTLLVVGVVIAATVIAIILLINSARNRGVEVKGGRLAAFWFVGICLTPIMLALYVLTLKPEPRVQAAGYRGPASPMPGHEGFGPYQGPHPEAAEAPQAQPSRPMTVEASAGASTALSGEGTTEPMPGFESPTQPLEVTETVRIDEANGDRANL